MKRIEKLFLLILTVAFIAMINTACEKPQKAPEPQKVQQPATGPITQDSSPNITGKVAETMNSGGYTYVKLEKEGREIWVAVGEADIKVGDDMAFYSGSVMHNFTSKTLGRTFDSIVFSPGPIGVQGDPNHSEFMSTGAVKPEMENIQVEKAAGADAYTIGELYEKSADLNAKSVTVKGAVVKVSTGIMGMNWVHMQDGSGDIAAGSHNLVVTTDDVPLVGETITVSGTLTKDKDFGQGYKYAVILENAAVSK